MILSPATLDMLTDLVGKPRDATRIAPCLLGPIRLLLRDLLVREALRLYGPVPKTQRARALASDLARDVQGGGPRADFCAAILAANSDQPLAWRQLVNIADGLTRNSAIVPLQRNPRSVQLC